MLLHTDSSKGQQSATDDAGAPRLVAPSPTGPRINFYGCKREYGMFSNFHRAPITIDGKEYPTTEHYFQAMKFVGHPDAVEKVRLAKTPAKSKQLGGRRAQLAPLRPDWEQVKVRIMYKACLAKFTQHKRLQRDLLKTGDAYIAEHTPRDAVWGDGGDGSGLNYLGRVLMAVRSTLRGQPYQLPGEGVTDPLEESSNVDEDAEESTSPQQQQKKKPKRSRVQSASLTSSSSSVDQSPVTTPSLSPRPLAQKGIDSYFSPQPDTASKTVASTFSSTSSSSSSSPRQKQKQKQKQKQTQMEGQQHKLSASSKDTSAPSNVVNKQGDLLKATEDYIAHQCNCVSNYAKGLAKFVFSQYPDADIYSPRKTSKRKGVAGSISVTTTAEGQPNVINMLAQYAPGKPKTPESAFDSATNRLKWFEQCLCEIESYCKRQQNVGSIAFPYMIGCGLGGGDWDAYRNAIVNFAMRNPSITVSIYKLS